MLIRREFWSYRLRCRIQRRQRQRTRLMPDTWRMANHSPLSEALSVGWATLRISKPCRRRVLADAALELPAPRALFCAGKRRRKCAAPTCTVVAVLQGHDTHAVALTNTLHCVRALLCRAARWLRHATSTWRGRLPRCFSLAHPPHLSASP